MQTATWVEQFEAHARAVARRGEIPGMTVAIARRSETVYEGCFGERALGGGAAVTPDTVFGIGSVTKSMTCLAVMQLVDRGRLAVDDPVVKWLPEFRVPHPARSDPITVHHLMTHTSGLPPEPSLLHARATSMKRDPDLQQFATDLPPDFASYQEIHTYDELLALIAGQDFAMLGPPGRYFSYSNEGFALLQGIIERAGATPYLRYLRENIWGPLGMTRTGSQAEALAGFDDVMTPHVRRQEGDTSTVFASPVWHDINLIYGNGGLASTVRDLLRYLEVYRNAGRAGETQILSPEGVARMITPHVEVPTGGFYGYGLRVHPNWGGVRLIEHGGGNKGIAAHIAVVDDQFTVAGLTNLSEAPTQDVTLGAANALLERPLDTPLREFPEYPATPADLARIAGTYQAERQILRFLLVGDTLKVEMRGRQLDARPYAPDSVVVGKNMPARFLPGEDGEVWAVSFGLRIYPKVE
jgi:CubicO group peptidase (beta-lactamase class C family)